MVHSVFMRTENIIIVVCASLPLCFMYVPLFVCDQAYFGMDFIYIYIVICVVIIIEIENSAIKYGLINFHLDD